MNINILLMNVINFVKKYLPALAVLFVIMGVMNFSSYNPSQELRSFVPSNVTATESSFGVYRTCNVTANLYQVNAGSNVTISWTTQGFDVATLNGQSVTVQSGSHTFTNIQANTTYTLVAKTADGKSECVTSVTVVCIPVPPKPDPTCLLTPTAATVNEGESVTLDWTTTNAESATLTSFGNVPLNGSRNTGALSVNKNYTLAVLGLNGKTVNCHSAITVKPKPPIPDPTCTLAPATKTIFVGESVDLVWTSTNSERVTLTGYVEVPLNGTKNTGALSSNKNYTLDVYGINGKTTSCHSAITVKPIPPVLKCDLTLTKSVNKVVANPGDELTYTIKIKNTGTGDCTGGGVKIHDVLDSKLTYISETHTSNLSAGYENPGVAYNPTTRTLAWNGHTLTPGEEGTINWIGKINQTDSCDISWSINNTAKATAYELQNFTQWVSSNTVITTVSKSCPTPEPKCEAFVATPSTITKGQSAKLTWVTKNATKVFINNGIGEVTATGTVDVSPLSTLEFILTVTGTGTQSATCKTTVTVQELPVPKCTAFTATPNQLPVGGGAVKLAWTTVNATGVTISPTVGAVSNSGSTTVSIATTTTYNLVVTGQNNQSDTCAVTIPVAPPVPTPITCAANVSLSASPTSIKRGNGSVISWNTTGITSVSFNQGITATGLSGSVTVEPSATTDYTLTASDGTDTISCPVRITVTTSSGGGGGSTTPTCDLSVSKNRISRGDEVTLRWDSSRATNLEIVDSKGKEIISTHDLLSSDKDDLMDGSVKVAPTSDTTYTLTVERGSRERVCKVDVKVDNNIVVTQIRDQQPLVAGIALSQVPYTGFEAGPILTVTFYLLLLAWALYMAYLIAVRKDIIGGYKLVQPTSSGNTYLPEEIRPDVFVSSIKVPEVPPSFHAPANLPTGNPVVGYSVTHGASAIAKVSHSHQADDAVITALENHAHAKKTLLSSDALRHFIGTTNTAEERITALNDVIMAAKEKFPSEDGWVVINEKRMRDLCVTCSVNEISSSAAPYVPTIIPEGSGSLAEAIVTGNIIAAYEMIGHRPMFALADAASDLDSVYRNRRGGKAIVSEMLQKETTTLSDEKIMQMIAALTGALDGVYTDEASAVKMAIMKAVKVVA